MLGPYPAADLSAKTPGYLKLVQNPARCRQGRTLLAMDGRSAQAMLRLCAEFLNTVREIRARRNCGLPAGYKKALLYGRASILPVQAVTPCL